MGIHTQKLLSKICKLIYAKPYKTLLIITLTMKMLLHQGPARQKPIFSGITFLLSSQFFDSWWHYLIFVPELSYFFGVFMNLKFVETERGVSSSSTLLVSFGGHLWEELVCTCCYSSCNRCQVPYKCFIIDTFISLHCIADLSLFFTWLNTNWEILDTLSKYCKEIFCLPHTFCKLH